MQQTSTNLAPEALHWLFSVSSNPTVQSVVLQSIGGLPMASEGMFEALQDDTEAAGILHESLLNQCLQRKDGTPGRREPVPGMELRLERLLRLSSRYFDGGYNIYPNTDSFELAVTISFHNILSGKDGAFVSPEELLMNIVSRHAKLPPRCWFHLARRAVSQRAFDSLDPDNDDHTDMFPLHLCSAILHSFHTLPKGPTHDFDSPLVLDFNNVLFFFLDEISDDVLRLFSPFVEHPSLSEPSLPQSLKLIVAAIKFLLHRLSLPESNMSHTIICQSLTDAIHRIRMPYQKFSSQKATALITVLEDIIAPCVIPPVNIEPDWSDVCHETILAYKFLAPIAPFTCSLSALQSMVDFMKSHWDQTWPASYKSDGACGVLTDLLVKRIPVAFTAFHESQCLQFLGSHPFHKASVPMVSAYVAGVVAMQQGFR